ncbi:gliding motility lipoprotein GldD [Lacibacter sp. H407]|uniref:gliding motility lipoprotein GldD n=1 Tax=Lacibacter sp. H407 TaxID=3133423 RepID=UPI0030C4F80E
MKQLHNLSLHFINNVLQFGNRFVLLTSYFLLLLSIIACNSNPRPRPKGYFQIDFPEKQYKLFDEPGYPYTFEYPVYGNVLKDSTFFENQPENPYWVNLDFPELAGRIHISYKAIGGNNKFSNLVEDAFKMTSKHSLKASSIDEIPVQGGAGVTGFVFDIGGNAATGKQFFVTDSTSHFLRGALYFNTTPNYDSIRPVEQFLYKDMQHLIQTLKWRG